MTLNALMVTDHVVMVTPDGTVTDKGFTGIHAPEFHVDTDGYGSILAEHETDMIEMIRAQGWEVETGWTGQYSYSGPIMHPSEFIGGGLERHIRETPGYWVACSVTMLGDEEDAGWVVMHRPLPHADYPHEPGRLSDCWRCANECFCTGDPGDTECVFCASDSE